jgi:Asp-tRNA(Asn)/Glu-tRNA(Gln) amidotransferase A subunit family amidase
MTTPLTITDAAAALRSGELTSVELTKATFEQADRLDGELGVYLARFDQSALEAAAAADAELAAGVDRGPLHGIPIGVKDIIATDEGPTTAQSLILDPAWGDQGDAPVVARLRKAGAIVTGKTTTMEFACGMPDFEKPFPIPRNPWDTTRWPGGSSSGSGGGLAAGMFLGALGTDTGGSVRCPAAFCGISGLKQTFGLVPKSGCVPLGYSLDHIGPMARSARDCAEMLTVMAGFDASDPNTFEVEVPEYASLLDGSVTGLRLGVDRSVIGPTADPALAPVFEAAIAALADAGAEIVDVTIPYFEELTNATMLTWPAEAFAYHRRDLQARWGDYGAPTRAAITQGALISAGDFAQAQRVRRIGRDACLALLARVDALLTPTMNGPAVEVGASFGDVISTVMTPIWNGTGFPALAIPMGFNEAGLPLSLQIATKPLADGLALRIGDAYQQVTDWHLALPPLVAEPVAG